MVLNREARRAKRADFSYLPTMIKDNFAMTEPRPVVNMIVCHRMLYEKANYHLSGKRVYKPEDFLESLSGDCQDHTTALASMLKSCGLEVAIVLVGFREDDCLHVLVEIKNPLNSIDELLRSLRRYYKYQFDIHAEEIGYESFKGDDWVLADTAGKEDAGWTTYIGQLSSYKGRAVIDHGNGNWDWINMKKRKRI